MPNEILKMTTEIIVAHASMTPLTPKELLATIKAVHDFLAALDKKDKREVQETKPPAKRQQKPRKVKMKESPEAKVVENEEGLPVGDPDYMEFMESREG